jgi:hypothetical protein
MSTRHPSKKKPWKKKIYHRNEVKGKEQKALDLLKTWTCE